LLLPSYPLGGGVLTDYATKKWTFTAYADSVCTAAYGVESEKVRIYKIELDDTLADGTLETAYTGTITATGGTGPYTYEVTSGTLPAGLTLASNGAVTGTPTTAETAAFTVTATDANGDTGSREYSVTVAEWVSVASGFNQRWQSVDIYTATAGTYKLTHAGTFQRISGADGANVTPTGAQSVYAGNPTLPLLPAGAPATLTLPAVTYGVALYRLDAGAWTEAGASVIFTATDGQVIKVKDNVNDADAANEQNNHSFTLYKAQ
jgi:hypothetical protein